MEQTIQWKAAATYFDFEGEQPPELPIPTPNVLGILVLKQLYQRVHRLKKSLIIHIDGQHRSSKSTTACLIGTILDRTFIPNFNKRVVHTSEALIAAISEIEQKKIHGAVIICDEAGANLNNMKYFENVAQAISESVQVLGYLRVVIIFVSPMRGFILSSLRQMTHLYFHTRRGSNDYSICQMYALKYDPFHEKNYKQRPVVRLFGSRIIVPSLKIYKPPAWLLEKYQALEQERKPILLESLRTRSMGEDKPKQNKPDVAQLLAKIRNDPTPYLAPASKEGVRKLSLPRLRLNLKCSDTTAKYLKAEWEVLEYNRQSGTGA